MTTHALFRSAACAFALAAFAAGFGAPAQAAALAAADRKFVEQTAMGGMTEVELGKLASQKGSSEQIKQFGSQMVQDHQKAGDELKQLAQGKGVPVPTALDKSHQKEVDKLGKLAGAEFDREYAAKMVSDHRKTVSSMAKASKSAKDADVKSFAAKTLPTVQHHLKMAEAMHDAVKGRR